MSRLQLSAALSGNPRTAPIHAGRVPAQGLDLVVSRVHPSEMFWRQLHYHEFEVSEMSLSSLLVSRDRSDDSWVALPVFTSRSFFHTGVLVREDAGVEEPAQLAGKRIGVPEYQQTAALWARGVLLHEFGLRPESLHWFMERPPEQSHGGATGFVPPPGVELEYVPTDTDLGQMLLGGEIDATLLYIVDNNLVDRSRADVGQAGSGIRRLFRDPRAEAVRYFEKTGFYPINHCVVVRRDVVDRYPWVPLNLYSMFLEAKRLAAEEARAGVQPFVDAGLIGDAGCLSVDLMPYGVRAQRQILETITQYSFEQGLTSHQLSLAELFYEPTLEL